VLIAHHENPTYFLMNGSDIAYPVKVCFHSTPVGMTGSKTEQGTYTYIAMEETFSLPCRLLWLAL